MAVGDLQFMELPDWSCVASYPFVIPVTMNFGYLGQGDQDSISWLELRLACQVMLGQTVCAAHIHTHKMTRYRQPEKMWREIDWAKAHMGHVNSNSGEMAGIATTLNDQETPNLLQWVVRYGVSVVKTRVHAAANLAGVPQLAPLQL
eukprot:1151094-Pelagomonas_calceolata.AAC.1